MLGQKIARALQKTFRDQRWAPQKYRPSNGTSGMIFCERFCFRCVNDVDENCAILSKTLIYDIDDAEYPPEWIKDEAGPRCTAFLAIGDDAELAAARADERQASLF